MSFRALLDAALAGSQRRDPPATLPALAEMAPEDRLLRSASYEGMRRLAGRPLDPIAEVIAVEPSGPELRPSITPLAAARLLVILTNQPALLSEWLRLAEQGKWRVAHDCLPDLLEYAAAHEDIHDLVVLVGGERLAWLANLNPAWRFAARLDPEEQFTQGTPTERAQALRRIRRQNPARGRELLEASFKGRAERAETRSALLDALSEGLSTVDEPVLLEALQDSRKELREKGLRLIRRIPDSQFGQRWIERARTLVVVGDGQVIEIVEPTFRCGPRGAPDEPDPAWIDDGLDPRPPKGIGATAWTLQQTLALTPPSIWPRATLAAFQRSDWSQPLLSGLAQAAVAYADADWCEALLLANANARQNTARPPGTDAHRAPSASAPEVVLHLHAGALARALAPDRAEAVVVQLLELGAPGVAALVPGLQHAWSAGFSRVVVAQLPTLLADAAVRSVGLLHDASLRLDPTALPAAERLLEIPIEPVWARPALQRLVKTLTFRLAMRTELLSS